MNDLHLRPELERDVAMVGALLAEAFGGSDEAQLVATLRRDGDLVLSLIAELQAGVIGYLALSRLASPPRALALAPLAVAQRFRRKGVANALVRRALSVASLSEFDAVFVVGDPAYYARFGFDADAARSYTSPYDGPHFMLRVVPGATLASAPVVYPAAFSALGGPTGG